MAFSVSIKKLRAAIDTVQAQVNALSSTITAKWGVNGANTPAAIPAPKVFFDARATDANGSVTFTLPTGYFPTAVYYASADVQKDSVVSSGSATFAMVRSISKTQIVVQVYKSITITDNSIVGKNWSIESLAPGAALVTVLLMVWGA